MHQVMLQVIIWLLMVAILYGNFYYKFIIVIFATYGMKVKALEVVCKIKSIIDTEIWGYLIDRPEIFDIKTIKIADKLNKPELRLTLDYDEDYELIRNIYFNVPFKKVLNLYDILDYLDKNPEIAKINQNCVQLDLDEKIKEEIDRNYTKNLGKIKIIKKEIYSIT